MEPSERERGARNLAEALQRNSNIETLELRWIDSVNVAPILQSLGTNTMLKTLIVGPKPQSVDEVSTALQYLVERNTTIHAIEMMGWHFSETWFRPLAQSIIQSGSVSKLSFTSCSFTDAVSRQLFESIIQTKSNLHSLTLVVGSQMFPNILTFRAFLDAVSKSKLVRLHVRSIEGWLQFEALTICIPAMKVQDLVLAFFHVGHNAKQELLQAIKRNFSLRSLEAKFYHRDAFDDNDKERLNFFFNRNERLAQWVENPSTVPRHLWPEALKLAMEAGKDTLFRSLLVLSGSSIGIKRKRS